MARIKKNRNTRSQRRMKHRRRKPNIPELVYKFLVGAAVSDGRTERAYTTKCRCCGREKPYGEEVVDSADSPRVAGMGYRARNDAGRVSKPSVKRRAAFKDLSTSYLHKCVGDEGIKKARKYVKNALDFGVESGYLIPSDSTYKVLRVSSDLMKIGTRRNKISTCDGTVAQEGDNTRETPGRLEDLQVQEQRRRGRRGRRGRARRRRSRSVSRARRRSRDGRRRRGRRRRRSRTRSRSGSRSRSRSRGRRRLGSPQNPEEITEAEANDYEMDENRPKGNIHADDIEREPKTARSNPPDEGQSTKKGEEDGSDLSVDENESDDELETKKSNTTKL